MSRTTTTLRILLVEDDRAVRTLAKKVLSKAGHRITMASSPAEALSILKRHTESFDVLLTDIVMPGMDGLELAEKIIPAHPNIKTLFMSGFTEIDRKPLPAGLKLMQKPFSPESLLMNLENLCNVRP